MKKKALLLLGVVFLFAIGACMVPQALSAENKEFGVYNDWGKLREVMIGVEDDTIEPEWMSALKFLSKEGVEGAKKYGGTKTADVFPKNVKMIKDELAGLVRVLEERGVVVHRTKPMKYEEVKTYLDNVQKGNHSFGGEDYFRVIDNNVILINSLRLPFRRKQTFAVRAALEPLLKGSNARYVAMPTPSPHYDELDSFLEAGDILMDGFNVYVGYSGNGSSESGIEWLQQYLGPSYKVWTIKIDQSLLHLDCVLSLTKPGLLTYYPELVEELPEPLKDWDKIEVYRQEGEEEPFGANNLSLDENTIIVPKGYERVAKEYEKRGMEVIILPFDMTIQYGAGPRCLTAVLKRDR